MSQKIKTSVEIDGSLSASQIANATIDTDKFLVSDGGIIKYRTGAELATDLGISAGVTSKVQHQVKAGVAINKGQAVYVTGADGTNMIVGLASNATEATSSKTMGLLNATVSANGFADVITEGLLAGLDTSTAVAGNPVWLGTGGNLIYGLANKPYAPSHLVFIGIVTRVNANNGEIFVKVQNGFELDELHDVDLKTTTPINGHLLGFNGTLWVNKTIAGWLGYTPQAQLNGTGFVKASGTTITYDNTSYYPASNPNGYISTYTETDTLASVTGRGSSTSTLSSFNGGLTATKTAKNAYAIQVKGGLYGAPRLQLYDLAIDSNAFVGLGVDMSGAAYEFSNYFPRYNSNGKWSVGSWAGDFGSGQYVSGYNEKLWINESSAQFNVSLTGTADMRSPIFYDSNDTSYYTNPASTSVLSSVVLRGASAISFYGAGSGTYNIGSIYSSTSINSWEAPLETDSYTAARVPFILTWRGGYAAKGGLKLIGDASAELGGNVVLHSGNISSYAVPSSRTITINGTSYDLSANRSWTVTGTETDTLATVTGRGATTSTRVTLNGGWTVPDATMNYVGNFSTNDYSTMRFMSRAWADVQGANGLAYTFNTHTNGGSGGYGALQIYYGESGYVYAPTSFRAPIFYDSNDTAYYVNPHLTSRIESVWVRGAAASDGKVAVGGSTYAAAMNINYDQIWTASGNLHLQYSGGGNIDMNYGGGHTFSRTSLRAPIFYDYNNTDYYLDPDNTSRLYRLQVIGDWAGTSPNQGAINIRGQYPSMTFRNTISGNMWLRHMDGSGDVQHYFAPSGADANDWSIKHTMFTNGTFFSSSSMRSPIFYDSNDTGYYVDPASNSRLYKMLIHRGIAGGGQNIFSGLEGVETANGRGQLVISSSYSDLVIASSQANNQHGSTLSFTAYNPDNVNSYRKFVINQGNWGTRKHMLSFGYSDTEQTNPHSAINSSVNTLTLDGLNRRVGIKKEDPAYPLDVDGIVNTASGYISVGNPWGTANSAFFPNGITTAGGTNWIYGQTYIGNAPGNGAGHEFFTSGSMNSTGAHSATVYYDYNNSGYYLDPHSSSNLNAVNIQGLLQVAGSTGNYNEGMRLVSGTGSWSNIQFGANMTGAGTQANQWIVGKRPDGNFVMSLAGNQDGGSRFLIQQDGRVQSPVYYDGNDTNYYLDPNGTSNLDTITATRFASRMGSQSPDNSHPGFGIRPFYSWNIGQAYNSSAGYSNGISIGSHPGDQAYGFQIVQNMWDDQLYFRRYNGGWQGWRTALDNTNYGGYCNFGGNSVYGGIFYDGNNTGYYVDPASGSNFSSVYADNWFRTYGQTGLYSQSYGIHIYPQSGSAWSITGSGGNIELQFRSNHNSTIRGYVYADTSNNIGFLTSGGGWRLRCDDSGNAIATGDVTAYSDRRVKENIHTIDNALDKVNNLRGVYYTRIDSEDKQRKVGVIAQETLEVLPEVVGKDTDGMYNVAYGNITAVLIEAIKEQQTQIEELKQLVNKLINK
jgi:hypothetical protein